jgi:hypothetical protein
MHLRQAFALALVCAVVEPNLACHACTLIYCETALFVELVPAQQRFDAGSYALTWVSDDDHGSCEFEVAVDDRCAEWQSRPCVVDSECASETLGDDGHITVSIAEVPESLQITLEQGDRVVLDAEVEPDYDTSRPNGPGCEPECTQATVALPLSD